MQCTFFLLLIIILNISTSSYSKPCSGRRSSNKKVCFTNFTSFPGKQAPQLKKRKQKNKKQTSVTKSTSLSKSSDWQVRELFKTGVIHAFTFSGQDLLISYSGSLFHAHSSPVPLFPVFLRLRQFRCAFLGAFWHQVPATETVNNIYTTTWQFEPVFRFLSVQRQTFYILAIVLEYPFLSRNRVLETI